MEEIHPKLLETRVAGWFKIKDPGTAGPCPCLERYGEPCSPCLQVAHSVDPLWYRPGNLVILKTPGIRSGPSYAPTQYSVWEVTGVFEGGYRKLEQISDCQTFGPRWRAGIQALKALMSSLRAT